MVHIVVVYSEIPQSLLDTSCSPIRQKSQRLGSFKIVVRGVLLVSYHWSGVDSSSF